MERIIIVTRKDIIYLLLIFMLNNKRTYSRELLNDFRDDVYDYLSDCDDFIMFKVRFLTSGLQLDQPSWQLRRNFISFLNKIEKVYNS